MKTLKNKKIVKTLPKKEPIKIYTAPICSSCKKTKDWFYENGVPFKEINIMKVPLTRAELMEILTKTENGVYEIISRRSNVGKKSKMEFERMTISQLLDFIIANPSVLKRPIIVNERSLQIGYNEEEIERFLPREQREAYMRKI